MAPDVIELTDAAWQRHDFYMRLAIVVESGAKCLGSHVGAVIVRDDRVLGSGYNGTPAGYPNCTDAERGCRRCALRIEQPDAGCRDASTTSACASTPSRTPSPRPLASAPRLTGRCSTPRSSPASTVSRN